jgi:hypothetical protein
VLVECGSAAVLHAEGEQAEMAQGKIGIYVNPKRMKAFRASTVHAAPDNPDWVFISDDSMIGMVKIREIAAERKLVDDPQKLEWIGRTDEPAGS